MAILRSPYSTRNNVFHPPKLDPLDFVNFISQHESLSNEFCYANRLGPYEYHITPFSEINRDDYLTLSARGVTHTCFGQTEFLSIPAWKRQQSVYRKMVQIPFFARYRRWRTFVLWKREMRAERLRSYADLLSTNLFSLDAVLKVSLRRVQEICWEVQNFHLLDFPDIAVVRVPRKGEAIAGFSVKEAGSVPRSKDPETLKSFSQKQKQYLKQVLQTKLFVSWKNIVRELELNCAVSLKKFLESNGFLPAEISPEKTSPPTFCRGGFSGRRLSFMLIESGSSYTEKAAIRTQCRKIIKFLRVCQYLWDSAISQLALSTVRRVANTLRAYSMKVAINEGDDLDSLAERDARNFAERQLLDKELQDQQEQISKTRSKNRQSAAYYEFFRASMFQNAAGRRSNENISPLFEVECWLPETSDEPVGFVPDSSDFRHEVDALLCSAVQKICDFDSLLDLEEFRPFTAPLAGEVGREIVQKTGTSAGSTGPSEEDSSRRKEERSEVFSTELEGYGPAGTTTTSIVDHSSSGVSPPIEEMANPQEDEQSGEVNGPLQENEGGTSSAHGVPDDSPTTTALCHVGSASIAVGLASRLFQQILSNPEFQTLFDIISEEFLRLFRRVHQKATFFELHLDRYRENARLDLTRLEKAAVQQEKWSLALYNAAQMEIRQQERRRPGNSPRAGDRKNFPASSAPDPFVDYLVRTAAGENLADWTQTLASYQKQISSALEIPPTEHLGLFVLNASQARAKLVPSPQRCWDLLADFLPKLGHRQTSELTAEVKKAHDTLSTLPSNVDEYVSFTCFLEKTSHDFKLLQHRGIYCLDLLEVMSSFHIRLDTRLRSSFSDLSLMLNALRQQLGTGTGFYPWTVGFSAHQCRLSMVRPVSPVGSLRIVFVTVLSNLLS